MKKINLKKIGIYLSLVIVGGLFGWLINDSSPPETHTSSHQGHGHSTVAEIWTCSMHPQIREKEKGQCPICGMDLVPVSTLPETVGNNEIQMTEAAMQLANIQTVKVSAGAFTKTIKLQGVVNPDERRLFSVTAHFDGRVERLYADFTGQYIKKGQKLATLYSPDLVTAQKELFEAIKLKDSNPSFYQAAIHKLELWKLTDSQINSIIKKGEPQFYFDVYADRSGTIQRKNISEGEHVMDGMIMFEIADLSHVWVLFEVYENDLPWIAKGDSISFRIPSLPGQQLKSVISFIDPVASKQTRTVSIRAELANPDNQLKPEMFVEGIVHAKLRGADSSLIIPKSAVLWTGKRAIVYIKQPRYEQPTFQFREIELGADAGAYYVVQSGLVEGEEVATNGVFKIDAAAQLQGKASMMNPQATKTAEIHSHGAMRQTPAKKNNQAEGSVSNNNFDVKDSFKNQLKHVFEAYLPVKDALIESDVKKAGQMSQVLIEALRKVDMKLVKGTAHHRWMQDLEVLQSATEMISKAEALDVARIALSQLSDQLYLTLVEFKVKDLGAFRQFCPMAFDFKGAYWLSNSDEILNPYFGDEMLTCGNIDEVLK